MVGNGRRGWQPLTRGSSSHPGQNARAGGTVNPVNLHYGPAAVPDRSSPERAVELLQERGFTACEIDLEGKLWM